MIARQEVEELLEPYWASRASQMRSNIDDGWLDLVADTFRQVVAIDPSLKVQQIKEKFGSLRFYVASGNEEVESIIDAAERKSQSTCQDCGAEGKTGAKKSSFPSVFCEKDAPEGWTAYTDKD